MRTDHDRILDSFAVLTPTHKTCPGCGEVRPSADFHTHGSTIDRLAPYCRFCTESHGSHPAKDPMKTLGDLLEIDG